MAIAGIHIILPDLQTGGKQVERIVAHLRKLGPVRHIHPGSHSATSAATRTTTLGSVYSG